MFRGFLVAVSTIMLFHDSRNLSICLIPGEFCIEYCSTYGCCESLLFYMLRYIYMFTHDDVYDTLKPTLCAIPGELSY